MYVTEQRKCLGLIKVGRKNLFVTLPSSMATNTYAKAGSVEMKELRPLCVLDFYVHESCEQLTTALARWDGTPASKYKHVIDAMHYACSGVIAQRRAGRGSVLKVR